MPLSSERIRALLNPHRLDDARGAIPAPDADARSFHRAMAGYAPTPLLDLPGLAGAIGVRQVLLKDESKRFGLNAFKALGASYGMYRVLKRAWEAKHDEPFTYKRLWESDSPDAFDEVTFCAATEGNHGRAVAWIARQLGRKAVIFMPSHARPARIERIRSYGAEVIIVDGQYDDAALRAETESRANGWQVVADFGYEGYTEIPMWIESGYSTMMIEILEQLARNDRPLPEVVFLQAGGGCFAAGAVRSIVHGWPNEPRIVCVEPMEAACMFASASTADGAADRAPGSFDTICAGLNVPIPSSTSWPTLRARVDAFLALDDEHVRLARRALHRPVGDDPRIVSGESGAAGPAGLMALSGEPTLEAVRDAIGLNRDCRVLVISTEGDTDPEHYRRVVEGP